jgi:hypothetical protein
MRFPSALRASQCALLVTLALGCDEKPDDPADGSSSSPRVEGRQAAPTGSAAPDASGEKLTAPVVAAPNSTGPRCLAGTWHYDFSDSSLETMMSNIEGAKVLKKEGELLCEITLTEAVGAVKCSVKGGKPFAVEVSAHQPGLPPMLLHFEATGSTTSKFRLVGEKQMQVSEPKLGDLAMKTTVTIAGKPIPFPVMDMLQAFGGEMGSTSSYECSGNELKLRPEIEGTVTGWQILKRAP